MRFERLRSLFSPKEQKQSEQREQEKAPTPTDSPGSREDAEPVAEDEQQEDWEEEAQEAGEESPEQEERQEQTEDQPETMQGALEQDSIVDHVYTEAEVRSLTSCAFQMTEHEGRELGPGRRLGFVVPKEFQGRIVRDVVLQHRKAEKFRESIGTDGYDTHGAYSRVEVHDGTDKKWKEWKDPKGYSPDKFAEPRPVSDPENEVLHDWIATVGKLSPDALRITNVGDGHELSTVQIHGIEIVFFPDLENATFEESIYCEGTTFVDLESENPLPTYGGGSRTEGKYIGALPLNMRGSARYELGSDPGPGAALENGRLEIALQSGKELVQLEVAVGDTEHLDHVSPKTGRRTRLGYSKIWAGIQKAQTGETTWFIQNANVPPQGVLAGGPFPSDAHIEEGDKLIIEAREDTSYLMGWRIAYEEQK